MAHLRLIRSTGNPPVGTVFPLTADRTVIGRAQLAAPGEDFIYLAHHTVQRCHAAILKTTDGGCLAQDLQSRSGIYVNRKHYGAANPVPLADGDVIQICDFQFTFVAEDPGASIC